MRKAEKKTRGEVKLFVKDEPAPSLLIESFMGTPTLDLLCVLCVFAVKKS